MYFNLESPLEETTGAVGYATEDADIVLLDEEGEEKKCDGIGEIVVKSPTKRRRKQFESLEQVYCRCRPLIM